MQMDDQQRRADSSQIGILHSSESLGWNGIVVEQRYHPAGEYTFSSSPMHMICIHQGPPISIEQVRNGRVMTHVMARGNLQIVPAGVENTWRHQDGADHMHVLLTTKLLQHVAEDYEQNHIELLDHFSAQDLRIEHISSALLTEVLEGGNTGRLYAESLANALATHLIHAYTGIPRTLPEISKGLSPSLFKKVTSLVEDRLAEDLSLSDLALEAGLSPSHFSSLFRKTTGSSPHHYILQRRLERAHHLLKSTRLPVGEIASTVGFYDQSQLVRHMRRMMGVTPTYIRTHLS